MDKKNYILPIIEIINIDSVDIVTSSGEFGNNDAPGKMSDIATDGHFWN